MMSKRAPGLAGGAGSLGALHDVVRNMLRESVKRFAGDGPHVPESEVDSLAQLCMMGVSVTGTENPREFLRGVSDRLLEYIVQNREEIKKNPVIGKVHQFFLIEWCYRNGHLDGDWAWKWKNPKEGNLFYKPKVPLEKVRFPDARTGPDPSGA